MHTPHTHPAGFGDVVALVPRQLGYFPQDSVAVVSLRPGSAPSQLACGLMVRADLTPTPPADTGPLLASVVRHLADDNASAALVATFSNDTHLAARVREEYTAALTVLLGPGRVFTWHVDATAARCVGPCPAGPCHVPTPALVETGDFAAATGRLAASRTDLGAPLAADEPVAQAQEAGRSWAARYSPGSAARARAATALWLEAVTGARDARPVAPNTLGELGASITGMRDRDLIFTELVAALAAVTLSGDLEARATAAMDAILSSVPGVGRLPDEALTHAVIDLLRNVAAHADPAIRAQSLSLGAALAWWVGRTAQARILVTQALQCQPRHRFARLIGQSLDAALPPGWVQVSRAGAAAGNA